MLSPVRILVFNGGRPARIVEAYPYEFRSIVDGHFDHRHVPALPGEPDYVLGYRSPSGLASADLQAPVSYERHPAPFFFCRAGSEGGFASLSDADISYWLMRSETWHAGHHHG